ncbi:hypothetical protein FAZ19_19650 [Sphingobacterium alkalisoli]|uniref:Uncharacterized protein n=1 Tax=Sphingobacterium alkalisoli TaxID=1874115 RepID=A0A4U0GUV8_9SPHI|nr:hypothetical protein [Sphingobacterium alkalisoli]TJY62686.1 hypothetical protein FAZ19_19650 [Sphingobacterium alkalisoli]GGH28215.1 hypothetical protein GCM10011418_38700 [Sphingobacterium alkalisoli]
MNRIFTDLRVSNFVKNKNGDWAEIESVSSDEVSIVVEGTFFIVKKDFFDIIAITLTKEILLDCDFVEMSENLFFHKKAKTVVEIKPKWWGETELRHTNTILIDKRFPGSLLVRSQYLHDLQNKFFSITGRELCSSKFMVKRKLATM